MFVIQILGRPRLLLDGQPVQVVRRKARALVYYLAAHSSPLTREELLALLWPDLDRSAAQHTLRATLHELHKTLGNWLIIDKDSLSLAPQTEVDARLFDSRLSDPSADPELLAATVKLYRGDFLDGFSLPDPPEFDDWVAAERERYRRLARRGLATLADQYEKRGRFGDALDALNQALDFDLLQEDLQRSCLRLHYLAGDRASAIRRYEKLRKLLDEEMGVPPMAETQAMYEAIITDTLSSSSSNDVAADGPPQPRRSASTPRGRASAALPFVGRDAELKALRTLVSGHAGQLALIEGEPGIGKTRLAEELIRESGALIIRGAAHELEQSLPYQPIIEALRGLRSHPQWPALDGVLRRNLAPVWSAEIGRLLPEMAGTSFVHQRAISTPDDRHLWEALNQFLFAVSRQRPVIVFLDDLHWADASTLGMLGYLVRQAATEPIAFVGATRPFTPRSALAALLRALTGEGRLVRMTLSRLQPGDVASVARHLSPAYAHILAEWLTRTSEGNPYILAELVRHGRESGLLLAGGVVDLNALSASPIVPRTVHSLIQARLERLSEPARRILDAAVVVGREFEFDVVSRVAAVSETTVLDGLDELQTAGLICPLDGPRWAFDHSLTVEVAYREIGIARRQLLHRRVAEALEDIHQVRLDPVVGLIAKHLGEGNAPDRAAPYARRAGNQARRLAAWTEAIAFYQQSLAVADEDERTFIVRTMGDVYFLAGQIVRAAEAYREASTLARSRGEAALAEFLLGTALMFEEADLAEFMYGMRPLFEGADLTEVVTHFESAEALYREAGPISPKMLTQIKNALGICAARRGDLPRAVAFFRAASAAVQGTGHHAATLVYVVLAQTNLASYLRVLDRPDALEHALSGLRLARENGLLAYQPHLLSNLGEIALADGDLEAAGKYLTEGLDLTERFFIPYPIAGLMANLGRLAERRGQTATAVHWLSRALARADAMGTRHLAAQIRLWLIPLLPPTAAEACMAEVRTMAERQGRQCLLEEIARLEAKGLGARS
ncbi:MAG: hypothetical protein EPO21_02785 [Chloroflexota bacterium]|nr:MAG: hypothetical protein EPO21_02785 [Chloroflexota bacterium]